RPATSCSRFAPAPPTSRSTCSGLACDVSEFDEQVAEVVRRARLEGLQVEARCWMAELRSLLGEIIATGKHPRARGRQPFSRLTVDAFGWIRDDLAKYAALEPMESLRDDMADIVALLDAAEEVAR